MSLFKQCGNVWRWGITLNQQKCNMILHTWWFASMTSWGTLVSDCPHWVWIILFVDLQCRSMVEEKCIKVFSVFSIGSYWIYLLLGLDILYGFIWDLIDYMVYYSYIYVGDIIWDTLLMYFELFYMWYVGEWLMLLQKMQGSSLWKLGQKHYPDRMRADRNICLFANVRFL
jgi:hypothetical protein